MNALTICQPYASLILLPDTRPAFKRTENRVWYSDHKGPLIIHAGKNRSWLEEDPGRPGYDVYGFKIADLVFGAILGVVEQVGCFRADDIRDGRVPKNLLWLKDHQHVEGPWCHVFTNVRRFARPIPYSGSQRYFKVPNAKVPEVAYV